MSYLYTDLCAIMSDGRVLNGGDWTGVAALRCRPTEDERLSHSCHAERAAVPDLRQSAARRPVFITLSGYLLWCLVLAGGLPSELIVGLLPVTVIVVLAAAGAEGHRA